MGKVIATGNWRNVLVRPFINGVVLSVVFLILQPTVCVASRASPFDAIDAWNCVGHFAHLSLWVGVAVLIVETIIHSAVGAFAAGDARRMLTPFLDSVVIGCIAGGLLLYIRFRHNSQGEMHIFGTDQVDWAYAALMFLLPMIIVALIVFVAEVLVHHAAGVLRRRSGSTRREQV